MQVRISVIELYNEELSDLIATAEDESAGKLRKLRLLEDPKKGVVLQVNVFMYHANGLIQDYTFPLMHIASHHHTFLGQGVEERQVTTASDIFAILEATNKQRRTAETLCNKQSSRQHPVPFCELLEEKL
jgi:hypothetical protein